jgi:hypothetical protein
MTYRLHNDTLLRLEGCDAEVQVALAESDADLLAAEMAAVAAYQRWRELMRRVSAERRGTPAGDRAERLLEKTTWDLT